MNPEDVNPPPVTHDEVIRWVFCSRPVSRVLISFSYTQLHELGFDGYGIDFVNFPPGMLGFLQDQPNLHRYVSSLIPSFSVFQETQPP